MRRNQYTVVSRMVELALFSLLFFFKFPKIFVQSLSLESFDTTILDYNFEHGTFPKGFIWAVGSSAFQYEGAWNIDGKGPSIWDTLVHKNESPVTEGHTADVACNSYHLWQNDIQLIKNLGVTHYRMSLSWSRIIPDGLTEKVNDLGVQHYRRFFTELLASGVNPIVVLYHWDLPQHLQDMGGWLNESSSVWFQDYARLAFSLFGDKVGITGVKYWITFNEPMAFLNSGYGDGFRAPEISHCPWTCPYQAGHNVVKAHSMAWHVYNAEFREAQKGKLGLIVGSHWFEPESDNPECAEASERCLEFALGWFGNPFFNTGDYPSVMKNTIAEMSAREGLSSSRLPAFTEYQIRKNRGSADFVGLNHYSARLTNPIKKGETCRPNTNRDRQACWSYSADLPKSSMDWPFAPFGMRKILNWIRVKYGNPAVLVTENGWADSTGQLNDVARVRYLKYYINEVLKAHKDGCNIIGYTAWSLLDNFEWLHGYTQKFGIYFVYFSDPGRRRTAKASAAFYAKIVADNGFMPDSGKSDTTFRRMFMIFWVALPATVLFRWFVRKLRRKLRKLSLIFQR